MPAAMNATTMAAQQAAPLARQTVPLARSAGTSMKHGTDGAIMWATPYVDTARSWAAPRLEQSAVAISENIAPMISSALISAAHKIDASKPPPQHRLSKTTILAGSVLLTAAGAAAALSLRHRHDTSNGFSAMPTPEAEPDGDSGPADPGLPDADANGHPIV
jgi:hypothetical protein